MEPNKFKFKLKTYLKYLVLEPVFGRFELPNFRTINWAVMIFSLIIRWRLGLLITIPLAFIFYMLGEWKSGKAINWYRNYHYKRLREKGEFKNDK